MSELNRDFYKCVASKMFKTPYEEITDEQRVAAKKQLLDYMYDRRLEPSNVIVSGTLKEPFMLEALAIHEMKERGKITPLKDLYKRFISDHENNRY